MSTLNRGWAALATVTVAALTSLSLATAFAQDTATVVDQGHVDLLAPVVTDGVLDVRYKDGNTTPPTWHDPEQVVTHVKPESRIQVPDLPEYAFLKPCGQRPLARPRGAGPQRRLGGLEHRVPHRGPGGSELRALDPRLLLR